MNLNGVKTLFIIINTFLLSSCINQGNEKFDYLNYAIIPKPLSIDSTNNQRIFNSLNILENEKCKHEISIFKKTIQQLYTKKENLFNVKGYPLELKIDDNQNIASEYILEITKDEILITATNNTGLFYGLQSLIQLIALNNHDSIGDFKIPCLTIRDNYTFEHRGLMLDCCRHFFKISTIKKYLDLLALYKMNIFHWHLTEDQGWRIEIEKYPKLNSVGSWRKDSSGIYGGYYTKNEIKEIVEYASERHIQIIPEIELPGHSSAAIASYPNLSCNKKPIEVVNDWGVFKEIYCAGNDSVFIFIEDIINEITSLFPGELVHIGGDEAPKYRWEKCIKCQNRIKKEGLKNEHELQSYFIDRVANILAKKGKVIVGWDEIIDSDLVSPAIIQSWRGFNGGYNAAKSGKKAIMSPTSHAYFDYPISTTDLNKVYEFNPIPKGLDSVEKKLIIGGECNLWSERIFNEKDLDSKAFPRLLAMSEILWRNPEIKNYSIFKSKVKHHYELLERLNVHYGTEAVAVNIDLKKVEKNYYAEISTKVNGLNFKYKFSKKYFMPLSADKKVLINQSGNLTVQAFKNNKPYGESKKQTFSIHLANYKSIKYHVPFSKSYMGKGNTTLVDGVLGSLNFRDGNWQGFFGEDLDCVIDLDSVQKIQSIAVNCYQYSNSWILIPKKITVLTSNDNKKWTKLKDIIPKNHVKKRGKFIKKFTFNQLNLNTKYIRLKIENYGVLPIWHEAAGSKSWLFIDEIIVE